MRQEIQIAGTWRENKAVHRKITKVTADKELKKLCHKFLQEESETRSATTQGQCDTHLKLALKKGGSI